ncbi:UNVERIFIED_ORG: putative transposase [Sphingomonas sp. R1F5B]
MKGYSTDLTDEQWEHIRHMIPAAKHGGRPRTTPVRRAVDAIFYLVRTGCQWRQLPRDFPPWETVYRYFVAWTRLGIITKMQRALYRLIRMVEMREPMPSAVVIDSQSVKTGKAGGQRGFDGGKRVKGRKRHIVVDTLGLMVDVAVSPANVHDTKGAIRVLGRACQQLGCTPQLVHADGSYNGRPFRRWVDDNLGGRVQTSINETSPSRGFVPAKTRWVVERAFAWLGDYRRLDKDHERFIPHSVAMLRMAMVRFMLNRLSR